MYYPGRAAEVLERDLQQWYFLDCVPCARVPSLCHKWPGSIYADTLRDCHCSAVTGLTVTDLLVPYRLINWIRRSHAVGRDLSLRSAAVQCLLRLTAGHAEQVRPEG